MTSLISSRPLTFYESSLMPPVVLIPAFVCISYTILSDAPNMFIAFPKTAASMPKFISNMII